VQKLPVSSLDFLVAGTIAFAGVTLHSALTVLPFSLATHAASTVLLAFIISLAAAWIRRHPEPAMTPTEQVFHDCLAAAPDRIAGVNAAIAQLAPGAGVTLVPTLVEATYASLGSMPGRALDAWAAAQWPNYIQAWAEQHAAPPKTYEAFLAGRTLEKDDPDAPVTGVEDYRFLYPGGLAIDVMSSGIYMTVIGGKQKMGDNLEALEIELFRSWEVAV
jgi:hypothetical protein